MSRLWSSCRLPRSRIFAASHSAGDTQRMEELLTGNRSLVSAVSTDGWTPLHLAGIFSGKGDAARLLLNKGASATARSTNQMANTPLHAAAAGKHADLVKLLIEHGANANARQHGGWAPLHSAAQNGDLESAHALINAGADVSVRLRRQQPGSLSTSHSPPGVKRWSSSWKRSERSCNLSPEQIISELHTASLGALEKATTLEALEAIRVEALGRKGKLAEVSKTFGKLAPEERASAGKLLNAAKQDLETRLEQRKAALEFVATDARLESEWIDLTAPAPGVRPGSLHPITQVQRELEDLFVSLGFAIMDGPEVETEHYNFDALNIPADHPARDAQDTFWLKDGRLLRTHTSPVQIRALEKFGPPLKMIAPGRVFRNEEVDASHEHTFYQLEGMMV